MQGRPNQIAKHLIVDSKNMILRKTSNAVRLSERNRKHGTRNIIYNSCHEEQRQGEETYLISRSKINHSQQSSKAKLLRENTAGLHRQVNVGFKEALPHVADFYNLISLLQGL